MVSRGYSTTQCRYVTEIAERMQTVQWEPTVKSVVVRVAGPHARKFVILSILEVL